jgi:hypothetical protein
MMVKTSLPQRQKALETADALWFYIKHGKSDATLTLAQTAQALGVSSQGTAIERLAPFYEAGIFKRWKKSRRRCGFWSPWIEAELHRAQGGIVQPMVDFDSAVARASIPSGINAVFDIIEAHCNEGIDELNGLALQGAPDGYNGIGRFRDIQACVSRARRSIILGELELSPQAMRARIRRMRGAISGTR